VNGVVVRQQSSGIDSLVGGWWLGELDLLDVERLESQAARPGFDGSPFAEGRIAFRFLTKRHGDINVLEDAARGDAENSVGRFNEVVAFASGVLAAEMVDEGEAAAELFGFD
jgi:hypothetical protein